MTTKRKDKLQLIPWISSLILLAALLAERRNRLERTVETRIDAVPSLPLAKAIPANSETAPAVVVTNAFTWAQVESPDYKKFIANLRRVGCPEETIRDIIISDVNKLYAPRIAALRNSRGKFKFWATGHANSSGNWQIEKQIHELENERNGVLKELLGVDVRRESLKAAGQFDYLEHLLGHVPGERQDRAWSVLEKYRELEVEVQRRTAGLTTPDDEAELQRLRKTKDQELAAILSPGEIEEYALRGSDTANRLRAELTGFEPTEQEFREIFRLRNAEAENSLAPASVNERLQREQETEGKLKALLGEERYAEYTRAQDHDFRGVAELCQRYEVPKEKAAQVYALKQSIDAERQKIVTGSEVPEEQRAALLRQMADTAAASARQLLGDKAFAAYQQNGGFWLRPEEPQPQAQFRAPVIRLGN